MIALANPPLSPSLDQEDRQLALEYIAAAWNEAEVDGVAGESLAHAALFAALATLVGLHGEARAADIIAALPQQVREGEYSLNLVLQ